MQICINELNKEKGKKYIVISYNKIDTIEASKFSIIGTSKNGYYISDIFTQERNINLIDITGDKHNCMCKDYNWLPVYHSKFEIQELK